MKKNLRIVSATAAALLAVAPVAATAVVSAPASTVQAAAAKAGSLNVPSKLANGNASFAELSNKVQESQITKVQNYKNAQDAAKAQLQSVLRYNGLSKDLSVNYISDASTVGNKTTVTFQLSTTTVAGKKILKDAGYSVDNPTAAGFTVAKVSAADPASFTVVLVKGDEATEGEGSENVVPSNKNIFTTVFENDPNVAVNISATAETANNHTVNWGSTLNGQLVYTDAKGASHTALLHGDSNTTVYYADKNGNPVTNETVDHLSAGKLYVADFKDVTINLGNAAAGSKVKFVLPRTARFAKGADKDYNNVKTVTVDSNGIAHLGDVYAQFFAYNPTDLQEIHFYSEKTGNQVTSGNINLHAVNGKLGLYALYHAMNMEYVASQLDGGKGAAYQDQNYPDGTTLNVLPVAVQNDLRDQLKKQNITVDDNGYFTAPASFTVNMNAKSIFNGATASLPVTVTVDNVTPTATNETTKNVTIMHIATIYDKNGKATHEPALRAYNTVSVVSDPVSLKDEKGNDAGKFYKLAGKDQYIKVGNVDGTSRSLKHNSYVYKSTGKRNGKKVLKKGSSVTTYGKSFMIAGHQMYRIGKNQYVKKANF